MDRDSNDPSPEQIAKVKRQLLVREDSSRAMEDAASKAAAVRENMARLRALRLAKEAETARTEIAKGNQSPNARRKKRFR